MFWAGQTGIFVMGIGGSAVLAGLATAMLLFRHAVEPWMPMILSLALTFASKHSHVFIRYAPTYYPWIVGIFYAFGGVWLGLCALAAYNKPASDRRVDHYLARKQSFENSHTSTLLPRDEQ